MKRMRLADSSGHVTFVEEDVPQPKPEEGEVLIRVHAAGVTPTEITWYPTSHTESGGTRLGATLSHEFSGEVAAIGNGVDGLAIGQEVYGMNDWFEDGSLADYCITRPDWVAPKPKTLDHVKAASVPIGALTAWQGLFERAKLLAGERLLVHGGAGVVGIFVIQLARRCGAYIITTASVNDLEFVRKLGADEAIDYKATRFEEAVKNIDVVFDAVGGDTLQRSWGVLSKKGRLVTIASDSAATTDERIKQSFFIVEPSHQQLIEIGTLLDAGELHTWVNTILPLSRASDAYTGTVNKKGRGKLIVAGGERRGPAHWRGLHRRKSETLAPAGKDRSVISALLFFQSLFTYWFSRPALDRPSSPGGLECNRPPMPPARGARQRRQMSMDPPM